ncbi:MAG: hypothetical protein LBO64_03295 [Desulfovibrio sp.]|jgi:hypothetical protein|nr:hypothetical protein [Desulfovibrio sp.]
MEQKEARVVKFFWNGIKVDGKLYRAVYDMMRGSQKFPDGTITVYRRGYDETPRIPGLTVENDTDVMTDYFSADTIRILPDSPFYPAASRALEQYAARRKERAMRRYMAKAKLAAWLAGRKAV